MTMEPKTENREERIAGQRTEDEGHGTKPWFTKFEGKWVKPNDCGLGYGGGCSSCGCGCGCGNGGVQQEIGPFEGGISLLEDPKSSLIQHLKFPKPTGVRIAVVVDKIMVLIMILVVIIVKIGGFSSLSLK